MDSIRELAGGLPTIPESLRQETGNPVQTSRLPEDEKLSLSFPALDDPEVFSNKRLVRFWAIFGVGAFIWLAFPAFLMTPNHLIDSWAVGCFVSFIGTLGFVWLYGTARQSRFKWLAFVFAVFAWAIAFCYREPYLFFFAAAGAIALIADTIATHCFLIETCAPMNPKESQRLRSAWKHRLWKLGAIPGAELYPAYLLIAPACAYAFWYCEMQEAVVFSEDFTYRSLFVLGGAACAVFLLENLSSFLWKRPVRTWSTLRKAMRLGLRDWLTYDRGNSQSPGVHKSPFGVHGLRILLLACTCFMLTGFMVSPYQPGPLNTPIGDNDSDLRHLWRIQYGTFPYLDLEPKTREQIIEEVAERKQRKEQQEEDEAERKRRLDEMRRPGFVDSTVKALEESELSEEAQNVLLFSGGILLIATYPIFAFLVSLGLLWLGCLSACCGIAGRNKRLKQGDLISADDWHSILDEMEGCPKDSFEKQSLFLGVNAADNAPVLVPQKVFNDHAHILGDTGSGKTSIGIASIVSQLLRRANCSVVVLDLKGDDHALMEGVRRESVNAGLDFRWFTNLVGKSTHVFNPLAHDYLDGQPATIQADIIANALGLQYGRDYGRAFYGDANLELLTRALSEAGEPVRSFRQLDRLLAATSKRADREHRRNASHVVHVVKRLADSEALNCEDEVACKHAIDFSSVCRKPQTAYFHLSSGAGTGVSGEIARLALYSLMHSAYGVPPSERVQTYVIIDEFQRIVASNLEMVLQLARSLNIGLVLANQTISDLKTPGVDLIPAVSTNTRFRQVFASSYLDDQERLVRASGETVQHHASFLDSIASTVGLGSLSLSERVVSRQRLNDILLATDKEGRSLVQLRRGAGFAQYGGFSFVMQSGYTISEEEFIERKSAPWPEASDGTIKEFHRERNYQAQGAPKPDVTPPNPDIFL
ncbi:MAG: type IV secretory system conjugative DNA transfer family protein [Aureliella sp.]